MPQSLGIIGGKPHSSFYFVGYQDEFVFYLDPHFVQEAVLFNSEDFSPETYQCTQPQKMLFSEIDPCLAIGFLCQDESDFRQFCHHVTSMSEHYQVLFSIAETDSDFSEDDDLHDLVIVN